MRKNGFWSCKLKRPDTLKRHRTFEVAAKRVGDYGLVYSESDGSVKQVFNMLNGEIKAYDTEQHKSRCHLYGFDMKAEMRAFNIISDEAPALESSKQ